MKKFNEDIKPIQENTEPKLEKKQSPLNVSEHSKTGNENKANLLDNAKESLKAGKTVSGNSKDTVISDLASQIMGGKKINSVHDYLNSNQELKEFSILNTPVTSTINQQEFKNKVTEQKSKFKELRELIKSANRSKYIRKAEITDNSEIVKEGNRIKELISSLEHSSQTIENFKELTKHIGQIETNKESIRLQEEKCSQYFKQIKAEKLDTPEKQQIYKIFQKYLTESQNFHKETAERYQAPLVQLKEWLDTELEEIDKEIFNEQKKQFLIYKESDPLKQDTQKKTNLIHADQDISDKKYDDQCSAKNIFNTFANPIAKQLLLRQEEVTTNLKNISNTLQSITGQPIDSTVPNKLEEKSEKSSHRKQQSSEPLDSFVYRTKALDFDTPGKESDPKTQGSATDYKTRELDFDI